MKGKNKERVREAQKQADESTANDNAEDCVDEKDTTNCFNCGGTQGDGEEDQWVSSLLVP